MIKFTSIKFYDEFTGSGGGGVEKLNGNTGNKITAEVEFYSFRAVQDYFLKFTESTKTIEFVSVFLNTTFLQEGFKVGMTIRVEGTNDNNDDYTIATIADDGLSLTVVEALIDEEAEEASVFDITPVTEIDFLFNIIGNNDTINFISRIDKGALQRYSATEVDTENATPADMLISSDSWGWVTQEITDTATGASSDITIEGADWFENAQNFKIIHTFFIPPQYNVDYVLKMLNKIVPPEFQDGSSLKYICKIDAYSSPDSEILHEGENVNTQGIVCWYDQNNRRSRPNYYFDSIIYKDADGNDLESLDIEKVVDVTIRIKSRSANFEIINTQAVLDFLFLPTNENEFIGTPDTTFRQNFLWDRKLIAAGAGADGELVGTDYQVLTQIIVTAQTASILRIDFKVDFSDFIKEKLKNIEEAIRYFAFTVTTQDKDITDTQQSDRVNVICDVNTIRWDKSNPELITAVNNILAYSFPNIDNDPRTDINAFEGDPIYVEFPFHLNYEYTPPVECEDEPVTPTIERAGFQIVAVKEGCEDEFIVEEIIFDSSLVRKLDGVQTIDITQESNFRDLPFEYSNSWFKRDISFDQMFYSEVKKGFILHHSFIIGYAFWERLVEVANENEFTIFKDIESPVQAWATLQQQGWVLRWKPVITAKGINGFTETFDQYFDITVTEPGIYTTNYYDNETLLETKGITKGEKTLISWEADLPVLPSGFNTFYSYVFVDYIGGGKNIRRFASTEFNSEEDSPFEAPENFLNAADNSWASNNVRINIFADKIVVQTIYNDENGFVTIEDLLFYFKIGWYSGCFILTEGGGYVLDEQGQRTLLETCES
jgi:hypothetical protein